MSRYIIALGSSHHQGQQYISRALSHLEEMAMVTILGRSECFHNAAVLLRESILFVNAACAVTSPFPPQLFYQSLAALEVKLGRIRTDENTKRTIDIDVMLSLEQSYHSPNFQLPHRQLFARPFFIRPAIEALKAAHWPIPISLLKGQAKMGYHYLRATPKAT